MTITPCDAPDAASPPVCVEALILRHEPIRGLAYRRLMRGLGTNISPDRSARLLARLHDGDERHLVHSTSWRAAGDGRIVLTYLVHPDPDQESPATPLPNPPVIARSPSPGTPSPPGLAIGHVASHAVRHLAFLGRTDPVVAAHLAAWPGTRRALEGMPGMAAGELPRC
ncbi:hypothetical protein EES43_28925 [Streptomyces sp. ADI96-02]|uniref:hypothetical protein n=1 Tax=Streptomyces sp. ADI96-02 TaxID=1522760 RepID=UPI000F54F570|nr:hypothetical protein [Streptomyces sp. ADI96-02]RPK54599.1 hypothetical protein EES43_28925 [Streptomyces sp. ADI96-02]